MLRKRAEGGDDRELEQLADLYKPALWAPEKALLQAAAVARYAELHPEAAATGSDAVKAAMGECSADALRVRIPMCSFCLPWCASTRDAAASGAATGFSDIGAPLSML